MQFSVIFHKTKDWKNKSLLYTTQKDNTHQFKLYLWVYKLLSQSKQQASRASLDNDH